MLIKWHFKNDFILNSLFQITEEDYICEPCNNLLMRSVNEQLATSCDNAQASGSSQQGRRQVCSLCGRSILNRQSHPLVIDNPSEEQRQILTVLQSRITPRQVTFSLITICSQNRNQLFAFWTYP